MIPIGTVVIVTDMNLRKHEGVIASGPIMDAIGGYCYYVKENKHNGRFIGCYHEKMIDVKEQEK